MRRGLHFIEPVADPFVLKRVHGFTVHERHAVNLEKFSGFLDVFALNSNVVI